MSARSMAAMRLLIIGAWVWPHAVGATRRSTRSHSCLTPPRLVFFPLVGIARGPSWTRFVKHTLYCLRISWGECGWPSLCQAYFVLLAHAFVHPAVFGKAKQKATQGVLSAGHRAASCWGRLALAGQIDHLKVSLENKCSSQLSVVLGVRLGFAWRLQVRTAGEKGLSGTLTLQQWHGWGGGQVPWDAEFAAGSPGC